MEPEDFEKMTDALVEVSNEIQEVLHRAQIPLVVALGLLESVKAGLLQATMDM